MIDLMLQDSCVPATSAYGDRLGTLVQAIHLNRKRTRDDGRESREAEASLEKLDLVILKRKARIDDDVRCNGRSKTRHSVIGCKLVYVLLAVFDDGQLQRHPDLRRSKTDAGSSPHGFKHAADQILNRRRNDLVGGQRTARLAKDQFTGFTKFKNHLSNSCTKGVRSSGTRLRTSAINSSE